MHKLCQKILKIIFFCLFFLKSIPAGNTNCCKARTQKYKFFSYIQVTNFLFDPHKDDISMLTLGSVGLSFIFDGSTLVYVLFLYQTYLQCCIMSCCINDVRFCASDFYIFICLTKIHSHSFIHGDNENPYLIYIYKMTKITHKSICVWLEERFSLTSQNNSSVGR